MVRYVNADQVEMMLCANCEADGHCNMESVCPVIRCVRDARDVIVTDDDGNVIEHRKEEE